MAIVWGSWVQDRFRCGIEMLENPTTVGSGTTLVAVTTKCYIQTRYYGNDSGINWAVSGDIGSASGTTSFSHSGDLQYTLMGSKVTNFSTSYSGVIAVDATASVTGWVAYSGTAYSSTRTVIDQRPYVAPAAPSAMTLTRNSDTSHAIAWTANPTAGAPYDATYLERWDNVSNAYALVATFGSSTSYTDTATIADRQYRWRIRAKNSAGYSGFTYVPASGLQSTTPAAPAAPSAAKDASGNIVVTRGSISAVAANYEVWHAAGGVWDAAALATVTAATATYTHTAPNASVTHTYRLKAVSAGPVLTSANSGSSNVVQLLAAPNAPTNLAPNGAVMDATNAITISWQHNPVDTTPQTYRENRYRVNGGAWTQPGRAASTANSRSYAANTFTNGTLVEWQVRTWGSLTDITLGASPWSASATITTTGTPTTTVTSPGTSWTASTVSATWSHLDPESGVQSQWTATLYSATGAILESKSGSDASTSTTFTKKVLDATTYRIGVKTMDAAGLWSAEDNVTFAVTYSPPPVPVLTTDWGPENGYVNVFISNPTPVAPEVAAVSNRLWRSSDGGDTWALVADLVTVNSTATDYIPPLNQDVLYKATSVSATPSTAESIVSTVNTSGSPSVFINVGPKFGQVVRLTYGVDVSEDDDQAKTLVHFASRRFPVEFVGENEIEKFQVNALLFNPAIAGLAEWALESSTWAEIKDAARKAAPACFRTPWGTRQFVSIGGRSISGQSYEPTRKVSIEMTAVGWSELGE